MKINVRHLLALKGSVFETFIAVVEKGSFTGAADAMALSASSVTVQIKQLENIVGHKLFTRGKEQAALTEAGIEVHKLARTIVEGVSSFESGLAQNAVEMSGTVKYAMPHSCLLSPHFSMLLEKRTQYPGINLVVDLMLNDDVLNLIKENKADFGFVTEKVANPKLSYEKFCEEEYVMVSSSKAQLEGLDSSNLLDHQFVWYPAFDQFFSHWQSHFMAELEDVRAHSLNIPNRFSSIEGAIKMVIGGLGLSIFPRHTIQDVLDEGLIDEYPSKLPPLSNNIYIIQHVDAQKNPRVKQVIDWFLEMHTCDPE